MLKEVNEKESALIDLVRLVEYANVTIPVKAGEIQTPVTDTTVPNLKEGIRIVKTHRI